MSLVLESLVVGPRSLGTAGSREGRGPRVLGRAKLGTKLVTKSDCHYERSEGPLHFAPPKQVRFTIADVEAGAGVPQHARCSSLRSPIKLPISPLLTWGQTPRLPGRAHLGSFGFGQRPTTDDQRLFTSALPRSALLPEIPPAPAARPLATPPRSFHLTPARAVCVVPGWPR